uniref:Ig-like domain-containing protein n=1 Tax=Gopherus agassizii TaxID=38772 RepID=A0A452HY93_9SAUR
MELREWDALGAGTVSCCVSMHLARRGRDLILCLLLCTATLAPDVVAQFEGDITLNCLFPSQPGMNLQRLTLTWQKEQAGAEALVLHSYYYGKEQLERQDQIYRNRTQLDPEGLARGNASLTLRGIRIQDEGIYLSSTADLPLLCVPAPYSEVRLEVSVSSQVTLTCRAEGGYPEASVLWLDGARNNVTAESDTSLQRDLSGLCDVSSRILLPRTGYGNYTCILESPRQPRVVRHLSVSCSPGTRAGEGPSAHRGSGSVCVKCHLLMVPIIIYYKCNMTPLFSFIE